MNAATGEPLGTAAEEAARLLASLESWFKAPAGGAGVEHETADGHEGADAAGTAQPDSRPRAHGATCRACPLCRGVAYLRESHPDVLNHLTDAATHLVAAVRSLTEPGPDHAAERAAGDAEPRGADAGEDRPRPSRAVRIDVQPDLGDRANSASSEQEPAP